MESLKLRSQLAAGDRNGVLNMRAGWFSRLSSFQRVVDRRLRETAVVNVSMNQREQELLSKQLRWLSPSPRSEGVMVFAIVAAFVAGIILGALFLHQSDPMPSNSAMAAISHPYEVATRIPNSTP